jgi:translation initiation factor 2B subunit (eIF-2B alpha/beta/delta family)
MPQFNLPRKLVSTVQLWASLLLIILAFVFSMTPIITLKNIENEDKINEMIAELDLGAEIPIEERSREEVTHINGKIICSDKVNVINPGFDVTPHELIAGIITEKGIIRPDYTKSIAELFKS